jgi:hypothetical protein
LSGFFFNNEALSDYDYYWRVELGSRLTCDVNYDMFLSVTLNGKKFGFTSGEHGDDRRGPSVFPEALNFTCEYPELIPRDNSKTFLNCSEELDTKSDCHCEFW